MILYIFPEAGLVLFMSLYQWVGNAYCRDHPLWWILFTSQRSRFVLFLQQCRWLYVKHSQFEYFLQSNRTYGVVELSLWLVRVLSNVRSLCLLDLSDGQFSEWCVVDGSFFNSDAIPINLEKLNIPIVAVIFLYHRERLFFDYFAHFRTDYFGIIISGVLRGFQGVSRGFKGFQGVSWGLQGVFRGFKGF